MRSHTAITVLAIVLLAAVGAYAKIDVGLAIAMVAGAHGGTAAFTGRNSQ